MTPTSSAGGSEEEDIRTSAFNVTKVGSAAAGLIAVILGAVPAAAGSDPAIIIAAIAAGTAVILGALGLAAVDLSVRQRARQAALQFGHEDQSASTDFVVLPASDDLRLKQYPNGDEFEVRSGQVKGTEVTIWAAKDGGESVVLTLTKASAGP
ncbi:MAG TPA: hypothetical protein VMF55_07335 [Solirubrobacterales bacterium]|nr:hypothetical protein [Solirubrobacterales bacterium]